VLATGHQVVSSVTTREIVMTEITPTTTRLARSGPIKAKISRVVAFVIPIFQAPMPIRSLLRNLPKLMNYRALSNLLRSARFV